MKKLFTTLPLALFICGCTTFESAPVTAPETEQPPMAAPLPTPPSLLNTYPEGAMVLLNNVCVGHTPITNLDTVANDTIELYRPGYKPLKFKANTSNSPACSFVLEENDKYMQDLLLKAHVRFVARPDGLRLEPANLPVYRNGSFVIFDNAVGQDVHFVVEGITQQYVKLRTNTGIQLWFPIVKQPLPNNPPVVPNVPPTNAVGTTYFQQGVGYPSHVGTMYGNSSQNVQAPVMPQYSVY